MTDELEKTSPDADDEFLGRMNDPTSAATVRGPCGDGMEVYLYIRNDIVNRHLMMGFLTSVDCFFDATHSVRDTKGSTKLWVINKINIHFAHCLFLLQIRSRSSSIPISKRIIIRLLFIPVYYFMWLYAFDEIQFSAIECR